MSLRRLAWGLFALYVVLEAGTLWVIWRGPDGMDDAFGVVLVGYAFVGALIASRRPRGAVGWLLLAVAVAFAFQLFGEAYAHYPSTTPGYGAVVTAAALCFTVWVVLAVVYLPLVFPDGRLISRRWRPVAWLGGVALTASLVGLAFKPGDLGLSATVPNPIAASGTGGEVAEVVARAGGALIALSIVLAASSLVLRFRRARGAQRQQLKWFAYACLLALTALVLAGAAELVSAGWTDLLGTVGWTTFLLGVLVGIPVATGVAILRHRLYDIDVVINRTLVYGALTATLVVAYLSSVLLSRVVLSPVAGESALAVAVSTLAVAALFRPARAQIQAAVDRRFYRGRYDAARTLESFSARLRDELDLAALGTDLRRVVRETMQPAHVSLWLRESQQ